MKNISKDIQCFIQDSNLVSSKHKPQALLLQPTCLVLNFNYLLLTYCSHSWTYSALATYSVSTLVLPLSATIVIAMLVSMVYALPMSL